MVTLRQDENGNFSARKRLPKDTQDEYGRRFGQRLEAKFFCQASKGTAEAKRLFREWEAEVADRIKTIRAELRGEGIALTHKDAVALAGEWYQWYVANHEDNPGNPKSWDGMYDLLLDRMHERAPLEVLEDGMSQHPGWERAPEVRAHVRPFIADEGNTAQFLASRGIALTNEARTLFLDCVADNIFAAFSLLEKRANGDYTPDELPKTFPSFSSQDTKADRLTPWKLFETWVKYKQPAQSTVESWRTVFNTLKRDFPDRSASSIKPDEAQQWLDRLITAERTAFTVHNTWLRATKTVFAWGMRRKLTSNPFEKAVVDLPKRKKLRPKWFYEHERMTILKAASAVTDTSKPDRAARRWVPWLLAYTGARPQEITQLRSLDVQEVDGIWTINITPEAGTEKTGKARTVPLHDHLIQQGFLDFVKAKGEGPLFYRPRRTQANPEQTRQAKLPAAQTRQRLAAWIREIGVTDKKLSPNHAWRHTFKQIGHRDDISERLLDYICGHAPATTGREYGEPTLKDLAKVILQFPRYEL